MKRLVVIFIAVAMVALGPSAQAQDAASMDIAALGERVLAVDSERLLMRLNTPIPAELLPQTFPEPAPLAGNLVSEQRAYFDDTLDGLRGSAIYTVDYMPLPEMATASPAAGASPTASPAASGPYTAFTSGTLTYLLFDEPVDLGDMDAFGTSIQQALGSDAQGGELETITVNDAPAVRVSSVALVNALEFHTEWIAIPVGNVVVVAMITEGSDTFDESRFRADNEALALAGVAYLQAIIEEMGAA